MKLRKILALVLAVVMVVSVASFYDAGVVKAADYEDYDPDLERDGADLDELGESVESEDPQAAHIDSVTESKGNIVVKFKMRSGANTYQIYRSKSRFGNYKVIDTVAQPASGDTVTYIDKNIDSESKYSNYYKVGYNGSEKNISLPNSLEITKFGFNTYVFDERDDNEAVDDLLFRIYKKQHYQQFGTDRFQLFFKPDTDGEGTSKYSDNVKVGDFTDLSVIRCGYNTAIAGLGKTPYDVELHNVWCPAALPKANATCNFWASIENALISDNRQDLDGIESALRDLYASRGEALYGPGENSAAINNVLDEGLENCFLWSVSQAAPARRMVVERDCNFDWKHGWASGGFFSDSRFLGKAGSYSQQQYYYRNCSFEGPTEDSIFGVNWNQVIQGCEGVKDATNTDNSGNTFSKGKDLQSGLGYSNWDSRGCTTVLDKTDSVREKPFLYFDKESDDYKVFVPKVRKNSVGISYTPDNMGDGYSIDLDKFYIVNPNNYSADAINDALGRGYNIMFQPGIYKLDKPLEVIYEDTIVMGLGLATLTVTDKNTDTFFRIRGLDIQKMLVEKSKDPIYKDIGGVQISSLLMDAGKKTNSMVEVGYEGANVDHSNNPCALHDITIRVGGTGTLGTTGSAVVVNSKNTVIDQTWIWRADHGDHVGWKENTAKNGIVVNGDDVTCYGLFVEHFQEYDILWRGENGRTYFLQNEKCYDPHPQSAWMSHNGTKKGYAAYKVANNVKKHYAVGMGIYDVFINTEGESIYLDSAIEVPNTDDVVIENACTVEIASADGPAVGINSLINNAECWPIRTGLDFTQSEEKGGYAIQRLLHYSNDTATALPNYYDMDDPVNGDKFDKDGIITNTQDFQGSAPTGDSKAEKTITKEPATKDKSVPLDNMNNSAFKTKIDEKTKLWELYLKFINGEVVTGETMTKVPQKTGDLVNVKVGKAKIKKLIKKKKSSKILKVKMKKLKNITGFRIAVFKSKKNAKKYKKKKKKKLVLSVKNYKFKKKLTFKVKSKKLKKKKKLFVMVRAYKKIGSKYYWGAWSAIKSKKIKK